MCWGLVLLWAYIHYEGNILVLFTPNTPVTFHWMCLHFFQVVLTPLSVVNKAVCLTEQISWLFWTHNTRIIWHNILRVTYKTNVMTCVFWHRTAFKPPTRTHTQVFIHLSIDILTFLLYDLCIFISSLYSISAVLRCFYSQVLFCRCLIDDFRGLFICLSFTLHMIQYTEVRWSQISFVFAYIYCEFTDGERNTYRRETHTVIQYKMYCDERLVFVVTDISLCDVTWQRPVMSSQRSACPWHRQSSHAPRYAVPFTLR